MRTGSAASKAPCWNSYRPKYEWSTGGWNPPAQLNRIFYRNVTIAGSSMGSRAELRRLVELCARGALQPLVGSTHRLDDAAIAFSDMVRGEVRGKIVLTGN